MAKYQINYEALDVDADKEKNGTPYAELLEWVETIVFAVFVVVLVFTFIFRLANVDGESMLPTLESGDKLIINHINYTPANGDIVVVDSKGLGKPIVKRIIASGGETVDIDFESGEVSVNGQVLSEDYILDLTKLDEGGHSYPVQVPADCYFVMGDNRMDSRDSRSADVGFVSADEIAGEAVFKLWPLDRIGAVE